MKALQLPAQRRRSQVVILDAIVPRVTSSTRRVISANVHLAIASACSVAAIITAALEADALTGILALTAVVSLSVSFFAKGGKQ